MTTNSLLSPEWSTRTLIRATVVVLLVLLSFALLYRFHRIFFLLFIGVVLSRALGPALDWLQRLGLPRALGIILLYLFLLAALVGFVWIVLPLAVEQATAAAPRLNTSYQTLQRQMLNSPSRLVQQLGARLPLEMSVFAFQQPATGEPLDTVAQALAYAGLAAGGLFTAFAILLLGFYWTLESERTIRSLLLLVPLDRRERARELVEAIGTGVGAYVRGQALLAILVGTLALVAYLLIGLPSALGLALVAGVMELVPLVGPLLGALPALLVALSSDGSKVVWVLVATAAIQLLENTLFVPRVMRKAVGVSPVVTLLAIAGFGSLLGWVGVLLAIPMAAIIQTLLDRFVLGPEALPPTALAGRDRLSVLRLEAQELSQDVRKRVRDKDGVMDGLADRVEEAVETIAGDLDHLLAHAFRAEQST